MKKYEMIINILSIASFIVALTTFIGNIYLADRVSTMGMKLTKTTTTLEEHKKYNLLLSYEYNTLTSSSVIYTRAIDSGYVKADIDYLESNPLAYR